METNTNIQERRYLKVAIIKAIFMFFTGLYALAKMVDGMNNKYADNKSKIINLIEIVVSIILTFVIYKIQEVQKMKVQEVLENYNSLKASITIVEGEIQELENEVLDAKSANLDGMPKPKGFVGSNIENYIAEKQEKIDKKNRYIERTKTKIKIVEDLVKTLKKYNQDIIEMKYYQMMSIEEIATKKDRMYGSIQKTIDRSIKIMQREYNKNKMS